MPTVVAKTQHARCSSDGERLVHSTAMPIHKLILRLDYKVNFALLDSPGTILRILNETQKPLWSSYADRRERRQVVAIFQDSDTKPSHFRHIAVDPTSTALLFESTVGIPLQRLLADETIAQTIARIDALCQHFGLIDLARLGFRIYYFTNLRAGAEPSVLDAFGSAIDSDLVRAIDSSVGRPSDYGLCVDGRADDKIEYHLRFGPYLAGEQGRYFEIIDSDQFVTQTSPDFVCDLDLYDTGFSLSSISLLKWLGPLVGKQEELLGRLEAIIARRCGG
jgi:hypothetical protein